MSLRSLVMQLVVLSEILYGNADTDPLLAIFNECCESGKNWIHASERNNCYSIPQPQITNNLDSLSISQNNEQLVRKCI